MSSPNPRVLIIGRSPTALLDAVKVLRAKGYAADATNQFADVLTNYDVGELELLVFGGMVPLDQKAQLRTEISRRNPQARIIDGLAGIGGVIAAQIESELDIGSRTAVIGYDEQRKVITLELSRPEHVVAAAWFGRFVPPVPTSSTADLIDADLGVGFHTIAVSPEASFATVSVGSQVGVLTISGVPSQTASLVPATAADRRLPEVAAVTTHNGEPSTATADV